MKILTLLGTRPEIIRLSRVIARLDGLCEHVLVHTGQNYDPKLTDVFFEELRVRRPDIDLGIRASQFAEQVGLILKRCGQVLADEKPDRMLILGDTNSGLAAIVAARMGIPVYHMEAGNRCYDDRVPEEINRRVIDHCSTVLMPYTHRSKENLLREGIERQRIFVIGNPINEVLRHFEQDIARSNVLQRLGVVPGGFFLVTLHRAENVDDPLRLHGLFEGLARVADRYRQPMIVSLHPRTAEKMATAGLKLGSERIRLVEPLGFLDFVRLEQEATCVLSDSGTVQEECAILCRPSVTLRDVTERAETIEVGSNILSGADPETILRCADLALSAGCSWTPPAEYVETDVSRTVAKILLGYRHPSSLAASYPTGSQANL